MSSVANDGYVECSSLLWKRFLQDLKRELDWQRPEAFERSKYVCGSLPSPMVDELKAAILAAPSAHMTKEIHYKAVPGALSAEDLKALNASTDYRKLDGRTRWALYPVLHYLARPVTQLLGCLWATHNVRSYISRENAQGGPHEWHTDGEPLEMLKIMVYFADGGLEIDTGGGTTKEIGGYGTWVLFYNSVLLHRAKPFPGRIATEITLTPWPVLNLEPRSLGINSRHPIFPMGYQ
jgi:hypothetical protein